MTFDVYIVGQIVRDINYLNKVESRVQTFGGTAFYSGVTYNSLGLTTAVLTFWKKNGKSERQIRIIFNVSYLKFPTFLLESEEWLYTKYKVNRKTRKNLYSVKFIQKNFFYCEK